jgi:hypothetical protein
MAEQVSESVTVGKIGIAAQGLRIGVETKGCQANGQE